MSMNTKPNIIILHGNHNTKHTDAWYSTLGDKFVEAGYQVDVRTHEENIINSRTEIINTLKNVIKCDENTIIIGHSSGSLACMRYAELYKALGLVLVTPYYSDMGNQHEKDSGYFDFIWDRTSMQKNVKWILQFSSDADPFIPYKEQSQVIRRMLRHKQDRNTWDIVEKFDFNFYKCIDMHHIGKKFKTANFIFELVNMKVMSLQLPQQLTSNEITDLDTTVTVNIELVEDGKEEESICIKSGYKLLPIDCELNIHWED